VTTVGKVVDNNYDMTGWAADPRLRVDAMLATDTQGRPIFGTENVDVTSGIAQSNLLGWSAFFNKGVSGRYWRAGNSVQTITQSGTTSTSGTYVIGAGGNTLSVAWNAAAATVQTGIQAWGGIFSTVTSRLHRRPLHRHVPGDHVERGPGSRTVQHRLQQPGPRRSQGSRCCNCVRRSRLHHPRVAGDWSQAAYGVGMDISIKVSNEANYFDGTNWHSAFQENLTLLLVEAYYGL